MSSSSNSERSKYKSWCFTLNNYAIEEYSGVLQSLRDISDYFIVGKEVGDSGTPHLQGYFRLKKANRLSYCRNQVSTRAHFEVSRGSALDNRVYCSKGNDYEEGGTLPSGKSHEGKRKSRDELAVEWRTAMESGRSGLSKFADDNPGVYAWSRFVLLRNSLGHARAIPRPDIHVKWIFGKPGVGKSRFAHESMPEAYIKEPRTKWWNGYMLERECIIDDFGPNGIDINHLLRWFDRYKCYVEIKGDMCPLMVDKFIVTSNFHPSNVFVDPKDGGIHPQCEALIRRLEIIEM